MPRLPVSLAIVERGSTSTRAAITDAAGGFAFRDLPVLGGPRVFLLRTQYQGAPYEGRATLTEAAPAQTVDLQVYQATTDPTAIRGTLAFAVIETDAGAVRVSVIESLANPSRRTVLFGAGQPLQFPLPPGAQAVDLIGGWMDPRVVNGAIADARPVPPAGAQVGYTYGLDPRARRFTLPWVMPYGAADVEVLVGDPALRLSAPGLRRIGDVVQGGRHYARWSGGPVPRAGEIALTIDGLRPSGDLWPVGAAALLCGLLTAGLAAALRRRGGPVEAGAGGEGVRWDAVEPQIPASVSLGTPPRR